MTLRYPEGLTSSVNARLGLTGPLASPLLSGDVDVYHANYSMRVDPNLGYLGLIAGGSGAGVEPVVSLPAPASDTPIRLDIRVKSDVVPFIENKEAEISGSADIEITGTFDHPIVTGRVELDSGRWEFGGNRYRLQSGSIDFSNPAQLEPYFDIAALTRVRATGQSYEISVRLSGSFRGGLKFNVQSEPHLPEFQIFSLLLGNTSDVSEAELRARSASQQQQNAAIQSAALVFLTSPISSTVGSVVERATFIDTVQIVPLLGNDTTLQQNPTARVTLGQRISSRLYLT
jgi:autotransporter translocation and assembly factor TamB